MTWRDIEGWFDFAEVYDRAIERTPPGGTMVEVGCWKGRSLAYLGQGSREAAKSLEIFGVEHGWGDSFLHPERSILPELLSNLDQCNVLQSVSVLGIASYRACQMFPDGSIDFVFVDGDHCHKKAKLDIQSWLPKVRPGGVLAGHDYRGGWPGVTQAVDEAFPDGVEFIPPSVWWKEIA